MSDPLAELWADEPPQDRLVAGYADDASLPYLEAAALLDGPDMDDDDDKGATC